MRCPRCGNENPGTNRFCGMCGATLLPAPVEVAATKTAGSTTGPRPAIVPAAPTVAAVSPPQPAVPAPVRESSPAISGPSFLGLNDPPPSSNSRRSTLSIDPNSSSRSLDYLLEDEEPRRGGAGKFFLILLALALAAGLGYLRWRHQGFEWLTGGTKKPPAIEAIDQPDSNPPPQTATNPAPAAPASPQASAPAPTAADSGTPPANAAATPTAPKSDSASPSDAPGSGDAPKSAPPSSTSSQAAPEKNNDTDSDSDSAESAPPAAAVPKPAPPKTTPKPSAAASPSSAGAVAEAQRYLYGKGVRQDCDRGLRLLKPAANRADPKAMIEMGALYSAGLCTPRDLPTAYRWFAMALRKQPDNTSVQGDLQKLWGEMTQPERQLAIKLSQ